MKNSYTAKKARDNIKRMAKLSKSFPKLLILLIVLIALLFVIFFSSIKSFYLSQLAALSQTSISQARHWDDKYRVKSVLDYGAKPNDGIDDTDAFNRAIGENSAKTKLFVPSGTYLISRPLVLKSEISLVGVSSNASVLKWAGEKNQWMIAINGGSQNLHHVRISNITLDGNNLNTTGGVGASLANNIELSGLEIKNFGDNALGIHFSREVTDSRIHHNKIHHIGVGSEWGAAVRWSWGSHRITVEDNIAHDTGRGGYLCNDNSNYAVIRNNVFYNATGEKLGIEVWTNCNYAVIEKNDIDHWLSVGVSDFVAIRDNVVRSKDLKITDEAALIGLEAVGNNLVFSRNFVGAGNMIGISSSKDHIKNNVLFAHNTVDSATTWGLQYENLTGGELKRHYFYDLTIKNTLDSGNPWAWSVAEEYSDVGHALRFFADVHDVTFDKFNLENNAGSAVQSVYGTSDNINFLNGTIDGNSGTYNTPFGEVSSGLRSVEWVNVDVPSDRGVTAIPQNRMTPQDFHHRLSVNLPEIVEVDKEYTLSVSSLENVSLKPRVTLWDLDESWPRTGEKVKYTFEREGKHVLNVVVWDQSNVAHHLEKEFFVVAELPRLSITETPNSRSVLKGGETIELKWKVTGLTSANNSIAIEIKKLDGKTEEHLLKANVSNPERSGQVLNTGSYSFVIPLDVVPGKYAVLMNASGATDKSGTFEIAAPPPVITLTSTVVENTPGRHTANYVMNMGTNLARSYWTVKAVCDSNVEAYDNNASSSDKLFENICNKSITLSNPDTLGQRAANITLINTNGHNSKFATITVTARNSQGKAIGSKSMKVSVLPMDISTLPTPTIRLLSPNTSATLAEGQEYTITWQSTGATTIDLQLYNSNTGNKNIITGLSSNQNSYTWKVSRLGNVSGSYAIGVRAKNAGHSVYDASDVTFAISSETLGAPISTVIAPSLVTRNNDLVPVTVLAPHGNNGLGEALTEGVTYKILWTAPGAEKVDLKLYDLRTSIHLSKSIATGIPNTGAYDWTVSRFGSAPGGNFAIQVTAWKGGVSYKNSVLKFFQIISPKL